MKNAILILTFFLGILQANAGFIIHSYYMNQNPPGCHHIFVVVTYDNGDGEGEIYVSSGEVTVGDGCPQGIIVSDENVVIPLDQVLLTPEANAELQAYLQSKGINGQSIQPNSEISVFCNPESGFVIVSRLTNTVDKIEVRNVQGVLQKTFTANPNLLSERYDISDLQPGIYIIVVGKDQITIHTDQVRRD